MLCVRELSRPRPSHDQTFAARSVWRHKRRSPIAPQIWPRPTSIMSLASVITWYVKVIGTLALALGHTGGQA